MLVHFHPDMSTKSDLQDVSLTLVAAVLLSSTCRLISDGDSYPISPNPLVSFGPRQILLLDYQLVVEVHKAILTQQLTFSRSWMMDGWSSKASSGLGSGMFLRRWCGSHLLHSSFRRPENDVSKGGHTSQPIEIKALITCGTVGMLNMVGLVKPTGYRTLVGWPENLETC